MIEVPAMITYDVYVVDTKERRKVITLNEHDISAIIREQAKSLFPYECLSIVTTVKNIEPKEDAN